MKQITNNVLVYVENGTLKLGFDLGHLDLNVDVDKIEVDPIRSDEEAEEPQYFRTIRVTTTSGQAVELSCSATRPEALEIQTVKRLPQLKPWVRKPDDSSWLAPKKVR